MWIAARLANCVAFLLFCMSAVSRLRYPGLQSGDLPVFAGFAVLFLFNTCLPRAPKPVVRWTAIIANLCVMILGLAAGLFGMADPVGLIFAILLLPPSILILVAYCLGATQGRNGTRMDAAQR